MEFYRLRDFKVGLNAFPHLTWLQSYGGQREQCGDLKENGPLRVTGSLTIRKCSLSGVDVALLEEVCLWEQALRFKMFKLSPIWHTVSSC